METKTIIRCTNRRQCLDITRGMFPVNPDSIIAHWGAKPRDGDGRQPCIIANHRRDFLFVGIPDSLSDAVRLKERRCHVVSHVPELLRAIRLSQWI